MALDPVSVAVGIVAAYAFSAVLLIVMCVVESRQAKKERDEAVDRLVAKVAVACIEQPMNVRVN